MSHVSEAIANSYRSGKNPMPNINNKITRARMKQYEAIKEATGGDPGNELDYSMQIINDNIPQIQRYVMSRGEVPATNMNKLIKQAYNLRCHEINAVAQSLDIPEKDAQVLIEMDESDDTELETSSADSFLGSLFAPIGIATTRMQMKERKGADNLDPSLVSGLLNTAGAKIGKADLIRAAQNKPAGILGFLGAGGTAHYNALREYFVKYPDIAKKVINGQYQSEDQLPNWIAATPGASGLPNVNIAGADITQAIRDAETKKQIKKYLPVIIIGIVALIVVVVLITKNAHKD